VTRRMYKKITQYVLIGQEKDRNREPTVSELREFLGKK